MVKTSFDLRANLISTKVSASHRKSMQVHPKPWANGVASRPKFSTQLRLLATPFVQGLTSCYHHQEQQPFDELFAINIPVELECLGRLRAPGKYLNEH